MAKSTKDFMRALHKYEGALDREYNPFAHVIRTPSPSANFVFGNSHGLPLGYGLILYGPPAGGKSVLCNAIIGQFHHDFDDGIAIKFDAEMREEAQNTSKQRRIWGIDDNRYMVYSVNQPDLIFDRIEKEIAALCQEGAPIKLIVIDSINAIQGRRSMNADSVMVQQIGDEAKTLQDGFKRILAVQRKYRIAVILTSHVRAEMDQAEQMRGNKVRMGASYGVQHYGEYFMYVEPNRSKTGKEDLLGKKLEDENVTDLMDKAEITGHKVRVTMKKSTFGSKMRTGEFTFDYNLGIVNRHEEVFLLGVNRNIIEKPNNLSYSFGDKRWAGKPATLQALKDDPQLQDAILLEVRKRDLAGAYAVEDMQAAQSDSVPDPELIEVS